MLGSNPSADSVASTESIRRDASASPFFIRFLQRAQHRERHQAINPGGAGAKPLHPAPATKRIPKQGDL